MVDVALLDGYIEFLVKLLTFNELVSLFMAAVIKISSSIDKIQNIVMFFSS